MMLKFRRLLLVILQLHSVLAAEFTIKTCVQLRQLSENIKHWHNSRQQQSSTMEKNVETLESLWFILSMPAPTPHYQ